MTKGHKISPCEYVVDLERTKASLRIRIEYMDERIKDRYQHQLNKIEEYERRNKSNANNGNTPERSE